MRIKILKAGFVILLATTVTLLISVRRLITGAAGLDEWVMRQALAVAQTYLVPTIEFDQFTFAPPGTVSYHGVRMIAPDGTRVVEADELIISLGKLPRKGEPIVIQGVTIRNGLLHLIADNDDPNTTFKGLAPFVKESNVKKQHELPREVRISETLDLRRITLDNACVTYDPNDGQPPMRLDGVSLTMNIDPNAGAGPVWHRIDLNLDRGDLFGLVIDGRINLDELAAELKTLTFKVDVGSDSVAALPPQLQQILTDHDAKGKLEINIAGAASFEQWQSSELSGEIALRRFNFALGEYRMPIDEGVLPINASGGKATLGPARFEMLHGVVHVTASVDLQSEAMPVVAEWSVDQIDLRDLLRTAAPEGEPPKIAGIVASIGSATAELTRFRESFSGRGEVHITEGRLINFPGVRKLNEMLDVAAMINKKESLTDSFDAEFTLTDEAVRVESSTLETNALLARGTGLVYYNQNLDLRINAGPMEKLQGMLGKVGEAIGKITDGLVDYHITGTLDEPELAVRPLGF